MDNYMSKSFLITILFTTFNCVFAQHEHSINNSENINVLFVTQNSHYTAEVLSETDEFIKDSSYILSLKLTSSIQVDTANVSLSILNIDSTLAVNRMILLNGKYSAQIKFKKEGNHVLKFTFNQISEDNAVNNLSFSFNTNVKNNNQADMEHDKGMMGMMGMGSTGFWIIMGGVMVAMMAVIMLINTNK